jgi:hypothetical protein
MTSLALRRHQIVLQPESARVIIRPFIPSSAQRLSTIIGRALALTEDEVEKEHAAVHEDFDARHYDIEPVLMSHFAKVKEHVFTQRPLGLVRMGTVVGLGRGCCFQTTSSHLCAT